MEAGDQVNEAREWEGGRSGKQDAETTRPHSALSTSSSSYTVSSASLPRTSPSSSPAASSYGDANEVTSAVETNLTPNVEEGRRPSSASGMGAAGETGLFRRSKSTPSLQGAEEDEKGRRSLWGWGQRPNLPPTHFYYCPHQPPRNLELREEDIPEGADRVKKIKEIIESDSPRATPTEEKSSPALETVPDNRHGDGDKEKKTKGNPYGKHFPYRTPSFGGSMIHIQYKSSTLPLRVQTTSKKAQNPPVSWRLTLPRDGVSNMYWNGISTVVGVGGKNNNKRTSPEKAIKDKLSKEKTAIHQEEDGEVRVSTSTLERIRARGSSVTYYGGRVVKQGSPADPTHVIMEEIRKQREAEEEVGLVEDLSGALKALGRQDAEWLEGRGRPDSSYGSAESTPAHTPTPSVAPTPPPPPSPRPLSPSSSAKVVSIVAKKGGAPEGGEHLIQPSWSGKCSVVFDFRRDKGEEGARGGWEGERGRDGAWEDGGRVCF